MTLQDPDEDELGNENIYYKQHRGDPSAPIRIYDEQGNELSDPHGGDPRGNPLARRQRERQEAEQRSREEQAAANEGQFSDGQSPFGSGDEHSMSVGYGWQAVQKDRKEKMY